MNSHLSENRIQNYGVFLEYRGEVYFWGIDEVF